MKAFLHQPTPPKALANAPTVGSVVTLKDLISTPELNGVQARVVGMDGGSGRISVALSSDPSRILSVKPSSLDVVHF